MNKAIYFFCTKLRMFLSVIPLGFMLAVCIIYNDELKTPIKLYPLIIALSLFILFIFVYFFRMVSVSTEEIRAIGLYSSKEVCIVQKGRTVVFTVRSKNRLRIELFGKEDSPVFDWMKEGDFGNDDIRLFSERAIGGQRSVGRFLKYLNISSEDIEKVFSEEDIRCEYRDYEITTSVVNEEKKVSIFFINTI